jgi:hypothetical protein
MQCFFQTSLTQNCLKLTIPGFPYNLFLVSCGGLAFLNNCIGQVLAWISDLKASLLTLGPSSHCKQFFCRIWSGVGCRYIVSVSFETSFGCFEFYTETVSFHVSIEPKQTEDQPKQFNREHIFLFFRKFWVVSV